MKSGEEQIRKLEEFQYRPFIKRVHILLPGYSYLHSTSKENVSTNVGRERTEAQFLNFLRKGKSKGSYLITGYRGMGKSTLVNKVVDEYIKGGNIKKICISFGQKNISEIDILKQIIYEIKNTFEAAHKNLFFWYRFFSSTLPILLVRY